MVGHARNLTYKVDLQGGQSRLKHAILYVAEQNVDAVRFGLIKLNKIIWKADFEAFACRGVPVTGRAYNRQKFGPVAHEMLRLHSEMLRDGFIKLKQVDFGNDVIERRTIAVDSPNLKLFSSDDLAFLDASIGYYWDKTGEEASDDSHGVAWSTRHDGEPMPYESSYLSDRSLDSAQRRRLEDLMLERGWTTE